VDGLHHGPEVAKFELYRKIEDLFFVFVGELDEGDLAGLLQRLILVKDFHMGGVQGVLLGDTTAAAG
jgi:hypothetical protein